MFGFDRVRAQVETGDRSLRYGLGTEIQCLMSNFEIRWQGKFLSKGGKEVLLKAAIQAIPTYVMSVFKLPDSFCSFVKKEMANFWWGAKDGERKLHWKSWKALCNAKSIGGLGFRSLKPFNQAMLAKQAWRIQTNQSPLLTNLFKAKYFSRTTFLNSSLGHSPSPRIFGLHQESQQQHQNQSQPATECHVETWSPLPIGSLKLNVDGAISSHRGKSGIGAIVRDSIGQVVAARASSHEGRCYRK
uniref:RNase H type-1 domain-containing protein n=1 Tax=Cannabis sativa TaxID=3483 RepID=A0A803P9K1_CANSA